MAWKEDPDDIEHGRGTEAPVKPSDRRSAQRFNLTITLFIGEWKAMAPEREVESVKVSEGGVYFETDTPLREGTIVQVRLGTPMEVTGGATVQWICIGKMSRARPIGSSGASSGVGVRFDCYEVSRVYGPSPAGVFSRGARKQLLGRGFYLSSNNM
jgi:hypothetical protein